MPHMASFFVSQSAAHISSFALRSASNALLRRRYCHMRSCCSRNFCPAGSATSNLRCAAGPLLFAEAYKPLNDTSREAVSSAIVCETEMVLVSSGQTGS